MVLLNSKHKTHFHSQLSKNVCCPPMKYFSNNYCNTDGGDVTTNFLFVCLFRLICFGTFFIILHHCVLLEMNLFPKSF